MKFQPPYLKFNCIKKTFKTSETIASFCLDAEKAFDVRVKQNKGNPSNIHVSITYQCMSKDRNGKRKCPLKCMQKSVAAGDVHS